MRDTRLIQIGKALEYWYFVQPLAPGLPSITGAEDFFVAGDRIDTDAMAFRSVVLLCLLDLRRDPLPLLEFGRIRDQTKRHRVKANQLARFLQAGNARSFRISGAWRRIGFAKNQNSCFTKCHSSQSK